MDTSIIISSCDAFEDCWEPMIYSIEKYWIDCPFPIYFISNYKEIESEKVTFIKVGKDLGFCSNLKNALKQIGTKYIIYFQEDYFLNKKVPDNHIKNHIDHCESECVDFLKIHNNDFLFRDKLRINNSDYCKNPIDSRYSINTSIAIWNKALLENLCIEGYSGWEWERNIINYINNNDIIINSEILHSSVYKDKSISTISGGAVAKGKWTLNGTEFLLKNGFNNLIGKRKVEGKMLSILAGLYNKNPNSIVKYPITLIVRLLNKFSINI